MPHCDPHDSFLLKQPSGADFEWLNLLFLWAGFSLVRVDHINADVKELFGFQGTSCNELFERPIKNSIAMQNWSVVTYRLRSNWIWLFSTILSTALIHPLPSEQTRKLEGTPVAVEKGTKAVISANFSRHAERRFNNLQTQFPGFEQQSMRALVGSAS